jgi:hypothetical protein
MKLFDNRNTIDIVVLCLTALIVSVIFVLATGVIVGKIIHPELNVSQAQETVGGLLNNIVGGLLGFIGGRAAGRLEAQNGQQPQAH